MTLAANGHGSHKPVQRLEESLVYGAKHYPTRTAITHMNARGSYEHVSYQELNTKACSLAGLLQHQFQISAAQSTPFVGVFLSRNINQIVAILATLIAGAAFVPLALDSPASNFSLIIDQTQVLGIITDSEQHIRLEDMLLKAGRDKILTLNMSEVEEFHDGAVLKIPTSCSSQSPAYVLFSSGTTGIPKGIVTPHSAVRTYCEGVNVLYEAVSADKWIRAATYTFDSSIDELFCPLSVGAEIVIQPKGALTSFRSYLKFLEDSGATILTLTTALWHQLANYVLNEKKAFPPEIRILSVGGEAALTSILKEWRARFKDYPRFLNGYGPTEATVCATYWEGQDNVEYPILPIGHPLPGYRCYVLDPLTKAPVNEGEEGVLFISGPGLAIGYLSNPNLTISKFLPNPWADSTDYSRMYNTGDLVCVDKGGVFNFRGRMDLQVKIRGFRVEIESIEACLSKMPGVKEVAIVASAEQQSHTLSAYVVSSLGDDGPLFVDDIIEYCSKRLAFYEIPAHFYRVEKLPHTTSWKVDRRMLNDVLTTPFPSREGKGKLAKVNYVLANLWCQCLDNVSTASLSHHSHFVHLGGHSLTLITLAAKIYSATGVNLNAIDLLNNPTLSQMSDLLDRRILTLGPKETVPAVIQPGHLNGKIVGRTHPLSRAQARLYTVQQISPESPVFNDGVAIKITGDVSYQDMYSALRSTLHRHEILRVKLVQDSAGKVLQEILPLDDLLFDTIFLHEFLAGPAAAQRAHEIFVKPFRIFENPLIRIALLSTGVDHILLVCAHHIIWDGFSDKVFLEELVSLYQGKQLPPPSSYFQHCYRSEAKPDESRLSSLVSYLASVPQLIELPIDFVRPDSQSFSHGRTVSFNIDPLAVARLVSRLGTTPFACLMTAFAVTLHLYAACQEDFMIGIPFANRSTPGEASAIGFFINTLPLRLRFTSISTLDELHLAVRQDLLFLAGLQDVPFDSLVNALNFNRLTSSDSLLQVLLNFTDAPEGNLDQGAQYSRLPLSNGAAHTDLTCFVERGKDGSLAGEIEYDSEIFRHGSVEALASVFVHILNAWSNRPTQSIHALKFPETSSHIPRRVAPFVTETSFGAYLASAARHHWDRLAVYDDNTGTDYSYKEIFSMSQRVQECLRPFKRLNGMVVLLVERTADAIAAVIGVSLAGLAFVPCDVSQPRLRIHAIIADSDPVCVIAHHQVLQRLGISQEDLSVPVLPLTSSLYGDLISANSPDDIIAENPSRASYMIYTSGSSGKPKGIVIGHSSIIQLVQEIVSWSKSGTSLHSLASSNLAWDMIFCQVYPALVTGGSVKLPKINGEKDGEYLSTLMRRSPWVNIVSATPSSIRMWLDQTQGQPQSLFSAGLHCIILGGEEVTPNCALRVLSQAGGSPNVQLIQPYGPTEGTVFSAYGLLKHSDLSRLTRCRRVPVDVLRPTAAMTVVNAAGHELPRGFVGELVIWGPSLMLEYHNMPELNEKKMIVKDGVRGWRSGDLGRHLPSNEYEIFGRMDSMCKIRGGFRVDLSEIETHIRSSITVDEAFVSLTDVMQESGNVSERQIVAHIRFKADDEVQGTSPMIVPQNVLNGLYRYLSHRVPSYMVPAYVIPVDCFPVLDSNKFDKSKLPKATSAHRFAMVVDEEVMWTAEDESRRELIEAILRIFTSVLSTDKKLSLRDNFYHCGGNSILATHTTSLIRREFGVALPFTAVITNPTASELAEFVGALQVQAARSVQLPPHIIPLQPAGSIPNPKAMLFAFPFIGGDLDMLPRVVNQFDNVKLGLVTYGLCWEPGCNLNTLEKVAEAYAKSIAALAGTTPCFLLGWCFGGMIACKTAIHLPKVTTHIILFDVLHLKIMDRFNMGEGDYAKAFGEYLCKVWFGPGLQSAERPGNKAAVIQAVLDAKLDWRDTASLVQLARRHVILPPWVTDADLAERMRPLADSHDLMAGVYGRSCCTPAEAIDIEDRVVVNLQAADGINVIFDTGIGLGWPSYEILDTDHDTIGYLPIATQRILAVLRSLIV